MSIEAGIGEKTEKALGEKKDKPDLSSVFDDWKNNTNKAENQTERAAVNKALHKVLPNLSIIDFTTDEKGEKYVTTFDGESNKLQLRTVSDFRVVKGQESDLTKAMAEKKATDEQVVQYLSDQVDDKVDIKRETETKTETKTNGDQPKPDETKTDETKTDETKSVNVKQYEIQPGDNLWKIARREIAESNKANGKPDSAPSTLEVKAFIEKIVMANQSGDNPVKNANLIYSGKTLNIPVEKQQNKTPVVDPATEKAENTTPVVDPATEKAENTTPVVDPATEKNENKTPVADPATEKKEEIDVEPVSANSSKSDVVNSASTSSANQFVPDANTFYNPTIGGAEADKEGAVLGKYFEQMRALDGNESTKAYVSADEINKFIEASKSHLPRKDGQPVPSAEEIELLEKAAKNIGRISKVSDDEFFTDSSGATRKDVQMFAEQEKDFESRFQARFYMDKHFDRLAAGQNHISVADIKTYREQLATQPNSEAELKAVDNVLVQLGKGGFNDGSVIFKDNAKASVRQEVAGSSYGEYGGRGYSLPPVAAK